MRFVVSRERLAFSAFTFARELAEAGGWLHIAFVRLLNLFDEHISLKVVV